MNEDPLILDHAVARTNQRTLGLGSPMANPMLFEHAVDKAGISRHQVKLSKKNEAVTRQ